MKNSLALVITEEDVNHIRNLYEKDKSLLSEATIPTELKDREGVKKFQDWLDANTDWLGGGKKLNKTGKGYGNFGPKTTAAWNANKDTYLKTLQSGTSDLWYVVDKNETSGYKKVDKIDDLKPYIESDRNVLVFSPAATQGAWKKASEVTQLLSIINTLPPVVPNLPGSELTGQSPAELSTPEIIKKFKDYVIGLGGNITFSDATNKFTQDVKDAWEKYGQGFIYANRNPERQAQVKSAFPNIINSSTYYGQSGIAGQSGVAGQ